MSEASAEQSGAHISRDEGKSFWFGTDLHTFKALSADTDGAFFLEEVTASPDFGAPPHIHHRQAESFYILEGTFEFTSDGRTFTAGAGSFVHLPKGRLHAHRAAENAPARALVLYTPAGLEKFIEEAGRPVIDRELRPSPPDLTELQRIVTIAHAYGIEVPPPSATAE